VVAAALHHRAHDVGRQDLPGLRRVAQPRRGVDRQPEVVAVLHRRVAQVQAHAHGERLVGPRVPAVDPLLDGHGAVHAGGGTREDCHQAVAGGLHLAPPGLGQRLAQHGEVLDPHLLGQRGTDAGLHPGRADEVGEQRGDRSQRAHLRRH
jgi:hypothetical protein